MLFSGLESMGVFIHLPSVIPPSESAVSSGRFSGKSPADHSGLAQPVLVSSTSSEGHDSCYHSESGPIPESRKQNCLCHIKQTFPPSLLDFLRSIYSELYSAENAEILLRACRDSTSHQYSSVWSSFCSFVNLRNPPEISDSFVLSFFRFLFREKGLALRTITSYKSVLARPLRLAFGIDVSIPVYVDFLKAFANNRPAKPFPPIRWSLDRALSLALSSRFQVSPSLKDRTLFTIFLLALATGARVSVLAALLREDEFVFFFSFFSVKGSLFTQTRFVFS